MKTLLNAITGIVGTFAFCGLLAWIESTPMTDAAVHQFADAFTLVVNLIK
jgi:hypothetical protein